MKYIGLQKQKRINTGRSMVLLCLLPVILLLCVLTIFHLLEPEGTPVRGVFMRCMNSVTPPMWFSIIGMTIYIIGRSLLKPEEFICAFMFSCCDIEPWYFTSDAPRKAVTALQEVALSAGIPTPKLRIIESTAVNAFTYGLTRRGRTITVTRGMVNLLTKAELKAVMAHEVTHILNKDTQLMMTAYFYTSVMYMAICIGALAVLWGAIRRSQYSVGFIIFGLLWIFLLWPWTILMIITRCCLSRKREYLADAGAVELTSDTASLIKALKKIESDSSPIGMMAFGGSMMFTEPTGENSRFFRLFNSHPTIKSRIEFLEGLACRSI